MASKKDLGGLDDLDPGKGLFATKGEATPVDHTEPVKPQAAQAPTAPQAETEELVHLTIQVTKTQRKKIHSYARGHDLSARDVMTLGYAALQHLEKQLGGMDAAQQALALLVEDFKR